MAETIISRIHCPFVLKTTGRQPAPKINGNRLLKNKITFKKVNPVGDTIIFGDSHTRGLESRRLTMGIGSLSGATFDSAIKYLQSDPTPDEAVKRVIFHLGTNHIHIESPTESLRDKLNILVTESTLQVPKCQNCLL